MTPERRGRLEAVLSKRQNDLTVILENVFDPHNISAVIRSCDAVGIMEIFLLHTMEPNHRHFDHYSAASAGKWVTMHHFSDLAPCLEAVRKKYLRIYTTHLDSESSELYKLDLTESVALVFGNEKKGISEAMRSQSDGNFVIPQLGMVPSLNISVACAISIFEAYRQKAAAGHYNVKKINDTEQRTLLEQWGETRLQD